MATRAAIYNGDCGTLIGQNVYLFQGFLQRVPVIEIARVGAYAHHEAFHDRGVDAHLGAKLVPDPGFTL